MTSSPDNVKCEAPCRVLVKLIVMASHMPCDLCKGGWLSVVVGAVVCGAVDGDGESGLAEDLFAVGVEAHAPEADARHQLLRPLKLAVPAEDGVDKLASTLLAHLQWLSRPSVFLCRLEHVGFADLEKLAETLPQALATFEEIFNHLSVLLFAHSRQSLFGSLDLAS